MKKRLLFALLPLSFTCLAQNPDTLLYERFETGSPSFVLNTADVGGASGSTGYNQWIINNVYAGGNGQLVCLGFPFNFTIPNTPTQPAAQTGSATSNYMHIMSDVGFAQGIQNNCFQAADGICGLDETNFAAMQQDLTTTSYDSVTVSFLWLCSGGTNIYGEFYYSTNSGSTWNVITTPVSQYRNQSNWVQQSVTLAGFAGQAAVRFGFRFVNQSSTAATEPGFGIDEFLVVGKNAVAPPVAAFSVSDTAICQSGCVDYTDLSTGNPTSWLWIFQGSATAFSTQQNPSQICYNSPGTYDVTLIVTSASGTDTLTTTTIVVHPDPAQPVLSLLGDTLYATPGYTSYQWYLDGVIINGATADTHVVLVDGGYTVAVTDSNGCSSTSTVLNFTTGLNETNSTPALVAYPNPAYGIFQIQNMGGFKNLVVVNALGEIISETDISLLQSVQLDLTKEPKGIYFLNAYHQSGSMHTEKLISW